MTRASQSHAPAAEAVTGPNTVTGLTALVLEDSPTQANIIIRLIAAQGWTAVHCLTPSEAMESLKTVEVQALFLDVFVGAQNTISLLPQFRRLAPHAPLVVMTAGSNRENLEETLAHARAARADHVLRKPFGEPQVRDILRGLCRDDAGHTRRRHILVIDDSGPVRSLARTILESGGYRVSLATSMEDAFKNINVAHVDMVLCDIFMPGMGGLNGMRHIQKVWPQVRIMAMSGGVEEFVSDSEALSAARSLGVHAQIGKPFTAEALLEVANIVLQDAQYID